MISKQLLEFTPVFAAAPLVVVPIQTYKETAGDDVTLVAMVSAHPGAYLVYWQRIDNNDVTNVTMGTRMHGSTPSNPSLTLSDLAISDGGRYRAIAVNSYGIGESGLTDLYIRCKYMYIKVKVV